MARLCQPCRALDLQRTDFTSSPWLPSERRNTNICVRTFASLVKSRSQCDLCDLIWHAFKKSDLDALSAVQGDDTWSLQWGQHTFDWQPDNETEGIEDEFGSALYPCFGEDGDRQDYGIQLVDEAETEGFLRGRLIGVKVDVSLLQAWIKRCKDQHGWRCRGSFLEPRDFDATGLAWLTVIDVEKLCLHDLDKPELVTPWGAQYVALSYVWGSDNNVRTLRSNEAQFRRPGGLDMDLPKTLADAIEVTRALGYSYLWIDSLCIVQDDDSTKQQLMDVMDAIYSNADVTIVASTGTGAGSGLSGWSDTSHRPQRVAVVSDTLRLGTLPYYQRELLDCDHSRRAWTYQETCLSPRCLIFLNGSVFFNCGLSVFSEQVYGEVDGIEPETSANTLGKSDEAQYPLQIWTQHVHSYTVRTLTHQSDGLNAFRGVVRAAPSALVVDSLNYSMPAQCFDWAILFVGTGLLRRAGFPSWSWIGWKGGIQMSLPTHRRYDQMWLLQGTWINWFRAWHSDGTCTAIGLTGTDFSARARAIVDALDSGQAIRAKANGNDSDESGHSSDAGGVDDIPTYARSSRDDSFGRRVHPEAMRLIPARPGDMYYEYTSCSPPDTSLLCFVAPCVSIRKSLPAESSRLDDLTTWSLIDQVGRVCGSVNPVRDARQSKLRTMKLLLLSVAAYGDLSQYHGSGLTGQVFQEYGVGDTLSGYIEEGPEGLGYFDFLNVMHIEETGRVVELRTTEGTKQVVVHERAGIGLIYREALRHVGNVSWTDFALA